MISIKLLNVSSSYTVWRFLCSANLYFHREWVICMPKASFTRIWSLRMCSVIQTKWSLQTLACSGCLGWYKKAGKSEINLCINKWLSEKWISVSGKPWLLSAFILYVCVYLEEKTCCGYLKAGSTTCLLRSFEKWAQTLMRTSCLSLKLLTFTLLGIDWYWSKQPAWVIYIVVC